MTQAQARDPREPAGLKQHVTTHRSSAIVEDRSSILA
jgi:hypothetical protein